MTSLDKLREAFRDVPLPLRVHFCGYAEDGTACGILDADGGSIVQDHSYDECHHPFDREIAEAIVNHVNEMLAVGPTGLAVSVIDHECDEGSDPYEGRTPWPHPNETSEES